MKYLTLILFLCTTVFKDCKGLYPIKDQLSISLDVIDHPLTTKIVNADFFQLRISETQDFIQVDSDNSADNVKVISEVPFRKFEQDTTVQDHHINNKKLVEETYIYLDQISKSKINDIGRAYYLVTYPLVTKRNFKKYLNDPHSILSATIKEVQIGYWVKKGEEVIILIKNNKEVFLMKGHYHLDHLGIDQVSHPQSKNQDYSYYERLFQSNSRSRSAEQIQLPYELPGKISISPLFESIKQITGFIDLDQIFDLGNEDELLFFNIPNSKRFIHEHDGKRELVSHFHLENQKLYFILNNNSTKNYQFNPFYVDIFEIEMN